LTVESTSMAAGRAISKADERRQEQGGAQMPQQHTAGANTSKKKMEMGLWLLILFGAVLLFGFGLMLIDLLLVG
jgi:hypothetical protein